MIMIDLKLGDQKRLNQTEAGDYQGAILGLLEAGDAILMG
jgi:hypothetical protein|tara:strand:+ start:1243 stop:1362 length:120 start_codon:yes stop_codon:yes gene_type:complete